MKKINNNSNPEILVLWSAVCKENHSLFELPELPYKDDALEPYMSARTISYHYGKHFRTYVNNLNNLIKDTEFEKMSMEDIVKKSDGGIFNNAAQSLNHNQFFMQLTPHKPGNTEPKGKLGKAIEKNFGSLAEFKEKFTAAGKSLFGSGWVWLVCDETGKMEILQTSNADTPVKAGKFPLLTMDVWEHTYYLDSQNDRAKYIENFWNILNWDYIENLFDKCC